MDNQLILPLSWASYNQEKSMEELRHSLVFMTRELERTRLAAEEEIRWREEEITRLRDFANGVVREKDNSQKKCQVLLMKKFLLQQQQGTTPHPGIPSIKNKLRRVDPYSDREESTVSSPVMDPIPPPLQMAATSKIQLALEKPLPEKGKLLEAVMKAGPLLETLLLAGPLPQWQHPPPSLDSIEIPPVLISSSPPPLHHKDSSININSNTSCGSINRKRGLVVCEGYDSSTKYQKVVFY